MSAESRKRWNFDRRGVPDILTHNGVEYISRKEAAHRLDLTPGGLDYQVRKSQLIGYRIPAVNNPSYNPTRPPVFFRAEDIAALLEKRSA
jgi:hypothetical protein